jgi:isoquinoline 1-oxidoreductase beta subunit
MESNFHDLRVAILADLPRIETTLITSGGPLGGMGELMTPLVAPALANALALASGKRIRSLPLIA